MNKSYWDSVFKDRSDLIIIHLMKKLDINQLDFNPTDIINDQEVFIGKINENTFRISILDAGTEVIGGDLI